MLRSHEDEIISASSHRDYASAAQYTRNFFNYLHIFYLALIQILKITSVAFILYLTNIVFNTPTKILKHLNF